MKKILIIVLLLVNFATKSYAQEDPRVASIKNKIELLKVDIAGLNEKVNVNITNTSLSNFLLAVSKVHNVNINVDQQLKNISIVNGFNDVTVGDLLVFLVKEYKLTIDFTGNILSVHSYKKPKPKAPAPKEIEVAYNYNKSTLSLDLNGDPLDQTFRKIMDVSGKNLLFSPEIRSKTLSIYINEVPFESALEKLSLANGIEFEKSEDGFYIFNKIPGQNTTGQRGQQANNTSQRIRAKRKKGNFYYKIIDKETKEISVDFENTTISDIVYTIVEELDLDIFIASPLENAGKATVKAKSIGFDELLVKMFETNKETNSGFTFKKEGNIYYFGTEQQLTLKHIEFVPLMHRSIELFGDASGGSSGTSRFSDSFSSSNGINFIGSGQNGIGGLGIGSQNINRQGNSNFSSGGSALNRGGAGNRGFSNTSPSSARNSQSSGSAQGGGDILSLFPAVVLENLDVKNDSELNGFVVSGTATKINTFKNFIKKIDKPVPVILIEVMILEVNRSATVEAGVEFGLREAPTTDVGQAFPSTAISLGATTINRIIGGFDNFGSLNLGNVRPNFYAEIRAMESNGNLKILSTPKLSTLNGHKAYLSSGQTTYYEVTNQNFFGSQIPQTSQVTNFQPIDAELAIEFKPYVSGDGQITLDIQVEQSNFGNRIDENAPPDINSRRFSSIIRMKENDVAILGGIELKFKNDSGSGVPILSRIPILKWLFSTRRREDRKEKLNVLIKPTVFY